MNERLRFLREEIGISRAVFGQQIGVSGDVINNLERGRVEIKEHILKLICSEFDVNEVWLRTGSGDMFSKTPSSTMEQLKKEFDLDEFSFNLVHEYLKLLPAQRKTIRDFVYRVIKPIENIDYTAETSKVTEELEERKQSSNHPTTGSEQDATMEEIEAEYKKSRLNSVWKTKSSALNSTADTEFGSENGDFASNQ